MGALSQYLHAQQPPTTYTWQQLLDKFEAANPTLKADQLNIDESRAAEITAYLRPNPDFSLSTDGFQISRNGGVWRPLSGVVETPGISYLHEREHKRELRRDQAKESTAVAESTYLDQERNLVFNLRNAFVQALQAKAVLQNAHGESDVLGSGTRGQPHAPQGRRYRAGGSGPAGTCSAFSSNPTSKPRW